VIPFPFEEALCLGSHLFEESGKTYSGVTEEDIPSEVSGKEHSGCFFLHRYTLGINCVQERYLGV
jgi:hypothetical protein